MLFLLVLYQLVFCLPCFLIGGLVFLYIINLNRFFNISPLTITNETLLWSSARVYIGIVISFFLTNVKTVFYALQSSYINNILSFISSILMLIYVLYFDLQIVMKL